MYKLFNWPYAISLVSIVLLVMTWGLWDNGGPWYVPFTILFLLFGFYCDFIEERDEMERTHSLVTKSDNKCSCKQSNLSQKAKDWQVYGNDDTCYDCDKQYVNAKELIEMTQTMSEAFSCNEPGIS